MELSRSLCVRSTKRLLIVPFVAVLLGACAVPGVNTITRPGGLDEGLASLTSDVREDSIDAFEVTALADSAYELENWPVAEKFYRRLTQQVPQDSYGYFRLGNSLMQQVKIGDAIKAYNQALIRDPNQVRALKNRSLAYLLQAELHLKDTVDTLDSVSDASVGNYREALLSLQRLNDVQLNETVSPLEGLYSEL